MIRKLGLVICSTLLAAQFIEAIAQETTASDHEPSPPAMEAVSEAIGTATAKPAKNVDLKDVVTNPAELLPLPRVSVPETSPLEDELTNDTARISNSARSAKSADEQPHRNVDYDPKAFDEAPADLPDEQAPASDGTKRQLILLGAEVLPGTTTRLAWSPSVSFLGISAPTSVLVVNGAKPGPRFCLTAAVHGDEINGIETVRRVLYDIDATALSGAVIGVPIVNLQGFRAGSRYLADRRDLNRFFPGNASGSAASRIAFSFFDEIVSQCDMLIDLHTGSFRRTNLPQLRADLSYPAVQSLAQAMGRIVVLQSKGAKGSLRREASESGIPTVTLEAGAPNELDKDAVDDSVASVRAALRGLGMTGTARSRKRSDAPVYYQSTWVRASEGGILISRATLGARVKSGEVLGAVTNPITNQRSEILSPANGRVIGMALNQVMHPGFAAYHLGIDPTAEPLGVSGDPSEIPQMLIEATDDEDPDNDQSAPVFNDASMPSSTDALLFNELLEDGESGR